MCHESTSVGLPQSIGIGEHRLLGNFDQTELVISISHNPGHQPSADDGHSA